MTEPHLAEGRRPDQGAQGSEISVLEILTAIGEEKKTIGLFAFVGVGVGLTIALLLPPIYTAKTTLLPPQQNQGGSSAVLASLGALAATAGVAGTVKAPEELYVGLLRTDSVANALIERFKLKERYKASTLDDTRRALNNNSVISADRKSTLISVEASDRDPVFSAQLANAYAEELRRLMTRIAVTEAQQRRLFFEQQMEKAKADYVRAELAVKRAQDKSGLISLDSQTQSIIGAAAQVRGEIVAREVQLQATRPFAGPENPDLKRLLSELGSLRAQLSKIEGGGIDSPARGAGDSAQALANVRIFRELKYQEAIYSAMLQQFQMAKADEARDAPLVQQVDVAAPPERKSKPRRTPIVFLSMALGLLSGLIVSLVRRVARNGRNDPRTAHRWNDLSSAWFSWRTRARP
ncbi:GumC family protein [Caenimonas terrae]|uniref:GumC family protein n=1 Tax=Caenimonas terrae TaxID=696074 RepID=A0ABW0NDL2_9BURK